MKEKGILHSQIASIIAGLGHGESIVIGDYGLPIPSHIPIIDLAVSENIPRVEQVLETVLSELVLEYAIIATELMERNQNHYDHLSVLCNVPIVTIAHDEFKKKLNNVRAAVRTGDWMPFSSIVLIAGVPF